MKNHQLTVYKAKWRDCQECDLCKTRTSIIHYRGSENPEILLLGEAPGQSEDIIGQPFVGAAGAKLEELIEWMWSNVSPIVPPSRRRQFFSYMNVVGCLPRDETGNGRTPTQQEIEACHPRFWQLYTCFSPKKVIALGKIAQDVLTDMEIEHSSLPHPAFLLRQKSRLPEEKWRLQFLKMVEEVL